MNYTTIEQSKKLIELGLDPQTADAWWCEMQPLKQVGMSLQLEPDGEPYIYLSLTKTERLAIARYNDTPAWSLDALLEAIPQSIQKWDDGSRIRKNYELNLFRSYYHCCSYSFGPSLKEENHDSLCCFGEDTWLNAVYKVALWLAEKGWLTCKREKGNWVMV